MVNSDPSALQAEDQTFWINALCLDIGADDALFRSCGSPAYDFVAERARPVVELLALTFPCPRHEIFTHTLSNETRSYQRRASEAVVNCAR